MALSSSNLSVSGWFPAILLAMAVPAYAAPAEPMRAAVGAPAEALPHQAASQYPAATQRVVRQRTVRQQAALGPTPQGFGVGLLNYWRSQPMLGAPTSAPAASASVNSNCLPAAIRTALADVQSRFGPVTVVSAHRPGARMGGGHMSHHANCQAADFRPAPGTYAAVASHLRQNWQGGLGTYSSGHIHIDTGPNYQWHGGGGRKRARR
jgi:hypothetical protein